MNNLDKQYLSICDDILTNGNHKTDRTGTGTISVFSTDIRYRFEDGKFPILTTKNVAFKTLTTELLWFLSGDTNIKYLVDNNCYIWVGDSFKNYYTKNNIKFENDEQFNLKRTEFINNIKESQKFADEWGELGPIYGKQWRNFNGVDQITELINDLKNNPDSRRLMVSAWNPSDLDKSILPPCHYGFQCYTTEISLTERYTYFNNKYLNQEFDISNKSITELLDENNVPKRKLSLKWTQRSADFGLGIPFNIASYGLLLEILSKMVNMIPDELIGSFGDSHLYTNHVDGIKEQLKRESYDLPKLIISDDVDFTNIDTFLNTSTRNSFSLGNYQHHSKISFPLSN